MKIQPLHPHVAPDELAVLRRADDTIKYTASAAVGSLVGALTIRADSGTTLQLTADNIQVDTLAAYWKHAEVDALCNGPLSIAEQAAVMNTAAVLAMMDQPAFKNMKKVFKHLVEMNYEEEDAIMQITNELGVSTPGYVKQDLDILSTAEIVSLLDKQHNRMMVQLGNIQKHVDDQNAMRYCKMEAVAPSAPPAWVPWPTAAAGIFPERKQWNDTIRDFDKWLAEVEVPEGKVMFDCSLPQLKTKQKGSAVTTLPQLKTKSVGSDIADMMAQEIAFADHVFNGPKITGYSEERLQQEISRALKQIELDKHWWNAIEEGRVDKDLRPTVDYIGLLNPQPQKKNDAQKVRDTFQAIGRSMRNTEMTKVSIPKARTSVGDIRKTFYFDLESNFSDFSVEQFFGKPCKKVDDPDKQHGSMRISHE